MKLTYKQRIISIFTALCAVSLLISPSYSQVYAKNGMVSSSSMIASKIGTEVLKKGGNAVDAAIATAFSMAVTWPTAGNIGGGGFLVFMNDEGNVTTIDFREKAPLAAHDKMYLDENGELIKNLNHLNTLAVGVPGTVAGLFMAHKKYGSLPWNDLVQPAVNLANEGFEFTWTLYHHAQRFEKNNVAYKGLLNYFRNEHGEIVNPGEIWKQPALGKTLERIRDKGQDGFYKGETAKKLAKFMKDNGGIITKEDLSKYTAIERKPVVGNYRGFDVYSMAPPSSGGVAIIEMLNMLENFDLNKIGYNSASYYHLLSEVMRRAFADRAEHVGDPDFNPDLPLNQLLSKQHANTLAKSINMDKASVSDSSKFNHMFEGDNTTHLSVADANGNAVSLTYTLEYAYGSRIFSEDLGFIFNNEMGDFNPVPGKTNSNGQIGTYPNLIVPEKRMLSSMTPTIIAKDGRPVLVVGSPGGRTIINSVLQTVVNVIDHKMDIATAIESPMIHHQWLPDKIRYQQWTLSPNTLNLLENMGHELMMSTREWKSIMGIYIDLENNILSGYSDSSSKDGGTAGY
ncbi:MAG: gamma-glutamyltransferase [Cyclobacteriaceae bacterium]|nr:gamma-glutamyltransferase [Cyclobacteriaceae bacterium]